MKWKPMVMMLMLWTFCCISCGGGGGGGSGTASSDSGGASSDPIVSIINEVPDTVIGNKTVWSESALEQYLPAMQEQVTNDMGPVWHISAQLKLGGSGGYVLRFKSGNGPDDGDHGVDDNGSPEASVYVENCIASGNDPLLVAQHEVMEMLADPSGNGNEIVDPVECWTYCVGQPVQPDQLECYDSSLVVPDFVFPAYFTGGAGPYDFMHLMKQPHGSCS